MKVIDKKYIDKNKRKVLKAIKNGLIFIYPTDTIYGIGTNALINTSVKKIRDIKHRELKPFSVIAPNIEWIEENCEVDKIAKKWLAKLPGSYTFFLDTKNKNCVSDEVNPADDSVGVRIPKHWFADLIKEAGVPFVTTSVNLSGQSHMRRIEDLDESMKKSVDYIIYEGEIDGKASEKIDLRKLEIIQEK